MTNLQKRFDSAVADSKNLREAPGDDVKLKMYALYKQASAGDVSGTRPGFTNIVGRVKYDAWAAVKGTSAAAAMQQYIDLVDSLRGRATTTNDATASTMSARENTTAAMNDHALVPREDWTAARLDVLAEEKALMRQMDALAAKRRAMPWTLVEKAYVFDAPEGRVTLSDLFAGRGQLVVYHFMFGPDWNQGCHRCSFWADNFDGIDVHLAHRDTTFIAASNTSREKIEAYKARMGWRFKWVSALGSDFNRDFHVSFAQAEIDAGDAYYNFRMKSPYFTEMSGLSVFAKLADGRVAYTYSTYARGIEVFNGAYQILDLTPGGRDEKGAPDPMFWLKRRDQYTD